MGAVRASNIVVVPGLPESGIVDVELGSTIEMYGMQPIQVYGIAPTPAELRHAFFDRNPDGTYVSEAHRQNVLDARNRGEWTSAFLHDGKELVVRPEKVFMSAGDIYATEGGRVVRVETPPDGWVLEYDIPTGFPSRTLDDTEGLIAAERIFGDDRSYFHAGRDGLRAIVCSNGWFSRNYGPFYVNAICNPNAHNSDFGVRSVRRHETAK